MGEQLKPCPFCGSTGADLYTSDLFGGPMIECDDCEMVFLPPQQLKRDIIAAWNRRASND